MNLRKIPDAKDWAGFETDLDVRYAHKLFFGKSVADVRQYFADGGRCIERADELLFMPRPAFQYYVFAFVDHVRSDASVGDSDAASTFLRLLINREQKDPGSVKAIYDDLREVVQFVAQNQARYDAETSIYGSFEELGRAIHDLCAQGPERKGRTGILQRTRGKDARR